jgi:hypothetical protein
MRRYTFCRKGATPAEFAERRTFLSAAKLQKGVPLSAEFADFCR